MILLLGGPPKVGKSTISGKVRQKHAVSVVSTDSLGVVLGNVWIDETAPDLFVKDKFAKIPLADKEKLLTKDHTDLIEFVRRESHVVWKAVVAFSRREYEEGRDVLIEGVAVLPELVNQLDNIPYRVVFVGNQGKGHNENIKRSAEDNEHDWMRDRDDLYISIFASFVNQMSAHIEKEAKRYGFEYIEMEKKSFSSVTEEVMKSFGLKTC